MILILFYRRFLKCYSLLKLFTGFANADFIAWKLIVTNVKIIVTVADNINTPGPIVIR